MPKRTDLKSIWIIGAGPIVIGQACEFDYSGAQAWPITIGPAPMIKILFRSVRLGMIILAVRAYQPISPDRSPSMATYRSNSGATSWGPGLASGWP